MTDHDSFMKAMWDYRLVMEAYDMIATYNSLERETTAHGSARSINIFRVSPRLAGKRKTFKVPSTPIREVESRYFLSSTQFKFVYYFREFDMVALILTSIDDCSNQIIWPIDDAKVAFGTHSNASAKLKDPFSSMIKENSFFATVKTNQVVFLSA